jgi:hypothetical protein
MLKNLLHSIAVATIAFTFTSIGNISTSYAQQAVGGTGAISGTSAFGMSGGSVVINGVTYGNAMNNGFGTTTFGNVTPGAPGAGTVFGALNAGSLSGTNSASGSTTATPVGANANAQNNATITGANSAITGASTIGGSSLIQGTSTIGGSTVNALSGVAGFSAVTGLSGVKNP